MSTICSLSLRRYFKMGSWIGSLGLSHLVGAIQVTMGDNFMIIKSGRHSLMHPVPIEAVCLLQLHYTGNIFQSDGYMCGYTYICTLNTIYQINQAALPCFIVEI